MNSTGDVYQEIATVFEALEENPYDRDNHAKLVALLRHSKATMLEELTNARKTMAETFALTNSEYYGWIEDSGLVEDEFARLSELREVYTRMVADNPSCTNWYQYLLFAVEAYEAHRNANEIHEAVFAESDIMALLEQGVRETAYAYQSSIVWELCYSFYSTKFQGPGGFETLKKFLLARLAVPHASIDSTFSMLSQLVSRYNNAKYEGEMRAASKIVSECKKRTSYFETRELELRTQDTVSPDTWIRYLAMESKRPAKFRNPQFIASIFARAIDDKVNDSSYIPVWRAYLAILYEHQASDVDTVLAKFIRYHPDSAVAFAESISHLDYMDFASINGFKAMRGRIGTVDLLHRAAPEDWKVLAMVLVTYEFKAVKNGNLDMITELYTDIENYATYAIDNTEDALHSVEKLCVAVYVELEDLPLGRRIIEQLLSKHKTQVENWLFALDYERQYGSPTEISALFERACLLLTIVDWPERIIDEWLRYEQLHGTPFSYQTACIKSQRKMHTVNVTRYELQLAQEQRQQEQMEQQLSAVSVSSTKRRRSEDEGPALHSQESKKDKQHHNSDEPPKRDREHLCVLVANLPANISKPVVSAFFRDCGEIKDLTLVQGEGSLFAKVEFTDERSVLAALTKNLKRMEGAELDVKRCLYNTIWVTNFPPEFSQERLEELFGVFGTIMSIRLPSLKFNSNRRFCYVEYLLPSSATNATSQLHGRTIDDHKLVVKISNPKEKQTVDKERRSVIVKNLDFRVSEETLRAHFAEYGEIEKITLPNSSQHPQSDRKNDGYGFIKFADEISALNAMAHDQFGLAGRPISVSMADASFKTKQKAPPASTHSDNRSATISILNIPDTIREAQIRQFFSTIGPVAGVTLKPEFGGALVEYETVLGAGKASMQLNGQIFEGIALKLGTPKELTQNVALPTSAKPKFLVPLNLRRRKALPQSGEKSASGDPPKSNEDFKKMFLGK
ncbi:hypothetical protein BABINDRAFT_5415 [Babjeviella inositovora NRRL Y-12698]|uniref:RRM domain-containing protein n=1 Tax=Babjeviella inositovora NRRL Y-12698 TaxID=984486 RepID=A0A1E3QXP9_9ASCO|nr:uncharacterized protein BABINDRAFT_5415 [Babjeviella inositovora NRRL Y-12698]ODQ82450.1 hypothetical protein BABINDRAFT_5415 [Babjeviella inositovora NRRL Y-12698]